MEYELDKLKAHGDEFSSAKVSWLDRGKPVVLYGAGHFGREVLAALRAWIENGLSFFCERTWRSKCDHGGWM